MPNLPNPSKLSVFFSSSRDQRVVLSSQLRRISNTPVPTKPHIARLILDQKSATQALSTFRWASKLPNFTHDKSSYRALIHKLCVFRRFDSVQELLDEMPSSIGSPPDEDIFVTIVRALGRSRMIRQVIKVLDLVSKFEMKPTLKLFNSILDVLVKEDIDLAREFYRKKMMGSGVQGDNYTYGILMKGLCLTNRIGDAFKLLQMMKRRGLTPNTVTYNTLIHALCKNGKLGVGRARSLMRDMLEPNDVTFNVLISTYCREGNLVQALVLLEKCFNLGFVPDVVTVTKVLEILCKNGRIAEAVEMLDRVELKGGSVDVVACNTLINGFCRSGKMKVGTQFLNKMERKGCLPNADTYNALISGFCESGTLDSALDMFNEMKMAGISWNFVTYDTLIRGLCSGGRTDYGFKILELMEDSKGGSGGRISPYNSILYGLYKENRLDDALDFLTNMGRLFPRAVDRSLRIIGLCEESGAEDAKNVYDQLIGEGGVPSVLVYVHLIHGFCQQGHVKEAFELMNEMVLHGYFPVASTFNALINGLCQQGNVGSAIKLMKDMTGRGCSPDSDSFSPLICCLCTKGEFQKGLMLFLEMVDKGIVPDRYSWTALVVCLSQETAWTAAKKTFRVDNILQWILET